jgi:phosphatidylserine/phosphatidylglycerophosphate/cardiolipin synthase-like enzyme
MRKILIFAALALFGCGNAAPPIERLGPSLPVVADSVAPSSCDTHSHVEWRVHFSPNGGTTAYLVEQLGTTQHSLYVQGYSFTSKPIAEALVNEVQQHHVHVEVILDKSDKTGKGSMLSTLRDGGVTVYVDDKHAIAHNKVIIKDGLVVYTGSFNFTNAAEHSNAENSIELVNAELAKVYQDNWEIHKQHSILQTN